MAKLAVVAFGGNALLRSGQKGTYQEQLQNVAQTCNSLLGLLKQDYTDLFFYQKNMSALHTN